jgi:hypothetical protein
MMIPIIARPTEELLLLVPETLREGALALGLRVLPRFLSPRHVADKKAPPRWPGSQSRK